MNCKEIIKAHLEKVGADGLSDGVCGCLKDHLFVSGDCNLEDCAPARITKDGMLWMTEEEVNLTHDDDLQTARILASGVSHESEDNYDYPDHCVGCDELKACIEANDFDCK